SGHKGGRIGQRDRYLIVGTSRIHHYSRKVSSTQSAQHDLPSSVAVTKRGLGMEEITAGREAERDHGVLIIGWPASRNIAVTRSRCAGGPHAPGSAGRSGSARRAGLAPVQRRAPRAAHAERI